MSSEAEIQARLTEALRGLVPDAGAAWVDANRYLRHHLATHADAGEMLHRLVEDPGFVVAADPVHLGAVLASADAHLADGPVRGVVRSFLRLGAANVGRRANERAANLAAIAAAEEPSADDLLATIDLARPWRGCRLFSRRTAFHSVLEGHTRGVQAVGWGEIDGRPRVVSGSDDGTVRVWDPVSGVSVRIPLLRPVHALAARGGTVAVGTDRSLLILSLSPLVNDYLR
ncbi:MAG: hypothetical protein ACK5PP_07585 [Acidimicrobiales bacterium]